MEKILVLDFGGQYDQLIARKIREQHIYAEIRPYGSITVEEIEAEGYRGIVFTGGPNNVYESSAPHFDPRVLAIGIPILGICYGAQLIGFMAGGAVTQAGSGGEYGNVIVRTEESALFAGLPPKSTCWMSHMDRISAPPAGYRIIAETDQCPCAALEDPSGTIFGVQFHPEVTHTEYGKQIFCNFLYGICGCRGDWHPAAFAKAQIDRYREELRGKDVLLALSGGVDSTVAAVLLHRAIGRRLICVFVDHGLLRKGEGDCVEQVLMRDMGLHIIRVNAGERFLAALSGITDPEEKRKVIGEEFIRIFEEEAKKAGQISVLAQGTIYPDIIESGKGDAAVIKSHHNVGGLPDAMDFQKIVEPLRELFKDEVRTIGESLGIPHDLVHRQPFPGPGLAVRIIGEVTKEKLEILQEADAIFREEIAAAASTDVPDQYFAVLTGADSVGVKGDARSYGAVVALRAVTTDDFMTADWTRLPYEILARAASRITNEISGVSRVVYDITSKPPATVEWE